MVQFYSPQTSSIAISMLGRAEYGDGFAFFLAPAGSTIPYNTTRGGSLGLTSNNERLNSSSNHFVAVEFDTYQNLYDPKGDHVGVDINSMQSVVNVTWFSSIPNDNMTDTGVTLSNTKPKDAPIKICALVLFAFWRKSKVREDDHVFDGSMTNEFQKSAGPKKFWYSELARCTNNFSQEEMLGWGGFGGVYKGYLSESNSYIAVKRVSRESQQGIKEYVSEVRIVSRLRHKHLVQLIGWCHQKRELLLVYEFMPNGSLDHHLFKGKSHLTWPIRFKIAQGLASALLYLHEEWEQCVVHRDIKSSNIMLDCNFNAKLGDFGLARLVDHDKGSQTTVLAGTMGYMAPECVTTGKANKETDVYSFGIVVLEIGCGRKPIDPKAEEHQVNIVDWVWRLYGMRNILEAVDPKLSSEFNEEEMEHLLIVGLWCAHPDSNCRPSIRQAVQVLNFEAPLPTLPRNMPVPTYCSFSHHLPTISLSSTHETNGTEIALAQIQHSVNENNIDASLKRTFSSASSSSTSVLYPS
ncbi:hypothetical protein KY285_037456 [Solanum tuberosum]|nr:hypothetical protein KY289_037699 [Solanum tuberosum]KAH0640870.1 hypothetical protein KY285_037456 [Solanum tuberosum]